MTTWPSASKATTTHTDAGSDKPRLARVDINQNILNVNDVIDMFNISNPTDGQLLTYNTTNNRFELNNSTSGYVDLSKNYKEKLLTLTSAATIAVNCATASIFTLTISHNANLVLSNMEAGTSVSLIITQDNDSTYNQVSIYAADSTAVKFPSGQLLLTNGNSAIDVIHIFYDGTNYLATVSNDFQAAF